MVKNGKPNGRRQQMIPGTEREQHPDVEEAATKYREVRDERMELTKKETHAKLALIATMQANGITKYKFDDAEGEELCAALEDKINVKVRKTGEAQSEVGEGLEPDADGAVPQSLVDQASQTEQQPAAPDGFAETRAAMAEPKKRGRPKKTKN